MQEGVRQFLFQVWADVMAVTAVRNGAQSEATKAMRAAAGDLIWSAGAKVTREERAEVIRKLPPLLKKLREGMESAGVPTDKRDEHVRLLNESLVLKANGLVVLEGGLKELLENLYPRAVRGVGIEIIRAQCLCLQIKITHVQSREQVMGLLE